MSEVLENLKSAVREVKLAHEAVYNANRELARAQKELEGAKTVAIMNGLKGKNDTARKAELAALTQDEERRVTESEATVKEAGLRLTLAEIDLRLAYALSAKENADANRALAAELLNVSH